jgi:hypothetical protein
MMPVPTHLRGLVTPADETLDEEALHARIRCLCGEDKFELLYPGQTQVHEGNTIPCTAQIGDRFFFLLKFRCAACSTEHLLFDADFHGWDGFVCHDPEQAAQERPALIPWKCQDCGEQRHSGVVHIQTQGKQDFIDEAGGDFDADRWPDAFGWFSLDLDCAGCGTHSEELISYETM